jgi:hypothetical protein
MRLGRETSGPSGTCKYLESPIWVLGHLNLKGLQASNDTSARICDLPFVVARPCPVVMLRRNELKNALLEAGEVFPAQGILARK